MKIRICWPILETALARKIMIVWTKIVYYVFFIDILCFLFLLLGNKKIM